jgi:hypothetical protein
LTWITHLPCHRREHLLRGTEITQKTILPFGSTS